MGHCVRAEMKIAPQSFTRILLRNATTGLYVQSADAWTADPDAAVDFKTMGQAIRFVEETDLRKMELAFQSPHLGLLTEVPLEMVAWGHSISKRSPQPA